MSKKNKTKSYNIIICYIIIIYAKVYIYTLDSAHKIIIKNKPGALQRWWWHNQFLVCLSICELRANSRRRRTPKYMYPLEMIRRRRSAGWSRRRPLPYFVRSHGPRKRAHARFIYYYYLYIYYIFPVKFSLVSVSVRHDRGRSANSKIIILNTYYYYCINTHILDALVRI